MFSIKLQGAKELFDQLAVLGRDVANVEMRSAVKEAMQPVLDKARSLAPVSVDGAHGRPPGYMRSKLGIKSGPTKSGYYCAVGFLAEEQDKSVPPYFLWVEYGHKLGGRKTAAKLGLARLKKPKNNATAVQKALYSQKQRLRRAVTKAINNSRQQIEERPFIRPAWESNKASVLSNLENRLRGRIAQIAKGGK